jgi:hypothetical protein
MDRVDAKLSMTPAIALARALEARHPAGSSGTRDAGVDSIDQSVWVSPKVAAVMPRSQESARPTRSDEVDTVESLAQAAAYVAGTLDMVAYARARADALVAYPIDRDTVP